MIAAMPSLSRLQFWRSTAALGFHRFPYQLTDDNLQTPASAASSGDVNTSGSHDSGRGKFPKARHIMPGHR
jgi:hypothetical protein